MYLISYLCVCICALMDLQLINNMDIPLKSVLYSRIEHTWLIFTLQLNDSQVTSQYYTKICILKMQITIQSDYIIITFIKTKCTVKCP